MSVEMSPRGDEREIGLTSKSMAASFFLFLWKAYDATLATLEPWHVWSLRTMASQRSLSVAPSPLRILIFDQWCKTRSMPMPPY